jgi:hypothetical protein
MNLLVLAKVFNGLKLNSGIDVLIEKIIHILSIKDRLEYANILICNQGSPMANFLRRL